MNVKMDTEKRHRIKPSLLEFAREGRKNPTHTEKMLWRMLSGRKIHGLKYRREHPVGKYIADFYCAEFKLIVEIDGDVHKRDDVKRQDIIRQNELERAGYRVIRFSSNEVFSDMDRVIEEIVKVCRSLPSPPTPLP